ncbi:MAG TPA: cupin domain-containing protein, partial [Roseimicrobium sp.]|nr:cupin domain-containing protein [Roseimicrobium sp.]
HGGTLNPFTSRSTDFIGFRTGAKTGCAFDGFMSHCARMAIEVKNLSEVPAFTTKDGSEIRELLAYRNSGIREQSLAEARLAVGASTQEHYHARTEEIYYITAGTGRIRIEGEERLVGVGDAIAIPPGQRHKLWNTGSTPLHLLCTCVPPYEHSDTYITEPES